MVLDCLCTDKEGTIYNIELQNDSFGASPKRARYHSGLIDMNISKKGKSFDYLPESYVIFIENTCQEGFKAKNCRELRERRRKSHDYIL